ncbi:LigT-like protein [Pluteus cervinus]|uniref:LigT-like protein n=1 Tax=Pluteus cervinus TaxID=181527 RepID=A0ACD3BEG7_9AGAR|nr:LigT-like protein [Pluteus cervinus]
MATRPTSEDIDSSTNTLSPSSYPTFVPHVTLASIPKETVVSPEKLRSAIPENQAPVQVNFQSIAIGSHYFRSVYIEVVPSAELLELHRKVHDRLAFEPRTPAFPHLSLCYVDDKDAKNGERMRFKAALEIQGKSDTSRSGEAGVGRRDGENKIYRFRAAEIWIVECEGVVEDWKVLQKINLTPSR